MSRVVEQALEAVKKTEFIFPKDDTGNIIMPQDGGRTLEVRDAHLFWTNFAGRENQYGNKATTFNLAVTPDVAAMLDEMGWRVRDVDLKDFQTKEVIEKLYFVNIKVNMDSNYPPIITAHSEFKGKRSRTTIDADSLSTLDAVEIQTADCIINMYSSKQYPDKVTGYLRKLNLIMEPAIDFGGKYDDWLSEDSREDILDDEPGGE